MKIIAGDQALLAHPRVSGENLNASLNALRPLWLIPA